MMPFIFVWWGSSGNNECKIITHILIALFCLGMIGGGVGLLSKDTEENNASMSTGIGMIIIGMIVAVLWIAFNCWVWRDNKKNRNKSMVNDSPPSTRNALSIPSNLLMLMRKAGPPSLSSPLRSTNHEEEGEEEADSLL